MTLPYFGMSASEELARATSTRPIFTLLPIGQAVQGDYPDNRHSLEGDADCLPPGFSPSLRRTDSKIGVCIVYLRGLTWTNITLDVPAMSWSSNVITSGIIAKADCPVR